MSNEPKLNAGDHIGHVVNWGLSETNGGNPQVYVAMDVGLTWFGYLNEGRAREITLEALVTMGFKGDDLADLVRNPVDALDKNKDLSLVVEHRTYKGKTKAEIIWVNEIGGGIKNKLDEADALKALSNLKVAGDLMKIRQEKGVKTESPAQETAGDIPF